MNHLQTLGAWHGRIGGMQCHRVLERRQKPIVLVTELETTKYPYDLLTRANGDSE